MGAVAGDDDGWEPLPTAAATVESYASEVQRQRQAARGALTPYAQVLQQLQQHGDAAPSAPSAPPEDPAAMSGCWGAGGVAYGPPPRLTPAPPGAAGAAAAAAGAAPLGVPSGSQADVLRLDPPTWLPDSYASHCGCCHLPFKAVLRLRHHCRLCGKVFCHSCCSKRLLLPPRYNQREPQRVCEMCSCLLQPLQPYLVGALSRSVQPPVHDALDAVSLRSWLNTPISGSLEDDVYKATNILSTFMAAFRLESEKALPSGLLSGARGLALLSVLRVGAGWSATVGSGLVVARQADGSWSAPCAAACYGVGWGAQIGGELADVLLVIRTDEALAAFCSSAHLGLGGAASASLGPVGRCAQAGLSLGTGGGGAVVGYSCSRGAYVGLSIEGSLFVVRDAANRSFYGYSTSARQLLIEGTVPQPPAAGMLYEKLRELTHRYDAHDFVAHVPVAAPTPTLESSAAAAAIAAAHAAEPFYASECGEEGYQGNVAEEDTAKPLGPEAYGEARARHRGAYGSAYEGEGEGAVSEEEVEGGRVPAVPGYEAAAAAVAGERLTAAAAAAGQGAADGLGSRAASAALRVLRGAASVAASGAAAAASGAAAAAAAARAGAASAIGGAGAADDRPAFITGSIGPVDPSSEPPAASLANSSSAAARSFHAAAANAPPAAAGAGWGAEFRLPAAPRHLYERWDSAQESDGEDERAHWEAQALWD